MNHNVFVCFFPYMHFFLCTMGESSCPSQRRRGESWKINILFFLGLKSHRWLFRWMAYPYHPWDWYIYLHLVDFCGTCRYIYHTWYGIDKAVSLASKVLSRDYCLCIPRHNIYIYIKYEWIYGCVYTGICPGRYASRGTCYLALIFRLM